MSDIPSNWEQMAIGELAKIVSGGTPASKDIANFAEPGRGIPWVTPADLSGYRKKFISRGRRDLSAKGLATSSAKVIPEGTVLFSSRAPIGYVAIAENEIATNQGFKNFVMPSGCDTRFTYYQLKLLKPQAEAIATGTTFKELSGSAAATLPFKVAPSAEQTRIADKLDAVLTRVDACRDRLDRIPDILKRFRQSVLDAASLGKLTMDWRARNPGKANARKLVNALTKAHEVAGGHQKGNASEPTDGVHDLNASNLPDGWQVITLKDACEPGRPITYGILKPGPELEDGVPYIRVADFPGNRLHTQGIKRTSPSIDSQFKRSRLRPDDLLLSIRGSVGRLIKIPAELNNANITQDTARLSISPLLNADFVMYCLLAPAMQRRMQKATRGVAVRGINIGDVRALQMPLPSNDEQAEIVRRVEALFSFADKLQVRFTAARAHTDHLTPALLAKAFRGELVAQDPNDEPASALLARIAADRAAAGKPAARGRRKAG